MGRRGRHQAGWGGRSCGSPRSPSWPVFSIRGAGGLQRGCPPCSRWGHFHRRGASLCGAPSLCQTLSSGFPRTTWWNLGSEWSPPREGQGRGHRAGQGLSRAWDADLLDAGAQAVSTQEKEEIDSEPGIGKQQGKFQKQTGIEAPQEPADLPPPSHPHSRSRGPLAAFAGDPQGQATGISQPISSPLLPTG